LLAKISRKSANKAKNISLKNVSLQIGYKLHQPLNNECARGKHAKNEHTALGQQKQKAK
jgi:hypothetical protein